jgi:hypothetical protein
MNIYKMFYRERAILYILVTVIFSCFLITGCAGSSSRISAPSVNYPVSLSPAVRTADGAIAMEDDLVKVGKFNYRYTTRTMLWTIIPLSQSCHDISNALNEQITRYKGDAVVNLKISNGGDAMITFKSFLTLGLLPSASEIEVTGDIVSLKVAPQ